MIGFFLRSVIGSSQLQRALRAHFRGIELAASRAFKLQS
jgi:hypothetical protein